MTDLRRHIAILGGSFNPVHVGHLKLADYVASLDDVDQTWLMLSPANPIKEKPWELIDEADRLEMLRRAVADNPRLDVCDLELSLPRPSYTANSLRELERRNPDCRFSLLIGSDNWQIFDRWREPEYIIENFSPIIYPRPGYPIDADSLPDGVRLVQAPTFDISSTQIRQGIADGKDMTAYLPPVVAEYINEHNLYKRK